MPFTADERAALLQLTGVGNTVIARLEALGLDSFQLLAQANVQDVLALGADLTRSSCWKNSPKAHAAIQAAIQCAQAQP